MEFTFEYDDQHYVVYFETVDDSFSHEFGTEKRSSIRIECVKVWCSAVKDEWFDITRDITDHFVEHIESQIRAEMEVP